MPAVLDEMRRRLDGVDLRVRGRIGPAWWAALGRAGLTEERWQELSVTARRAVIAAATGVLLLVVLTPFTGFDLSAFYTYLVFVFLYVPEWRRVPRLGKFLVPLGLRFPKTPHEHRTFMIVDPSGNVIEFKCYLRPENSY